MSCDPYTHGADLACPGPTPARIWVFTMDGVTPIATASDPDAPATEADIALEQLIARLQARWHHLRATLTRRGSEAT
jgi:hypothetical protein